MQFTHKRLVLVCSIFAALYPGLEAAAEQRGVLEEIVVTAQKREQNLQSTPLTIDVFSGAKVDQAQISSLSNVAALTPGFSMDMFPRSQPRAFIRGVGSSDTGAAGDQSTAVYVDNVYMSRPAMLAFDSFDIAQIEVIKGPQGTLWGKNVVGGLVHIITEKPDEELGARVQLTAGNYDTRNAAAMINVPITGNLLSRTVLISRKNDGFAKNEFTGEQLFDEDRVSARTHFLFTPSDDLELGLSATWADENNAGSARNKADGEVTGLFRDADGDPRITTGEVDGFEDREIWGVTGTLNWSVGAGEIHVIANHRELDYAFNEDLDGSNYGDTLDSAVDLILGGADPGDALLGADGGLLQLQVGGEEQTEVDSVEARYAIDFENGAFWQTGIYYENVTTQQRATAGGLTGSCYWAENSEYGPLGGALIDGLWGFLGLPFDTGSCGVMPELGTSVTDPVITEVFNQNNETNSYAIFSELTYPITDLTNLTGGVRWSKDEKTFTVDAAESFIGLTIDEPFDSVTASDDWDDVTWKVSVDSQISDQLFSYATVSTGYKAGGFQNTPSNPESAAASFDPEHVTNYELGVKYSSSDDALRLNLTGFFMDFEDLQVREVTGTRSVTENAGEAEIKGVEIEIIAMPVSNVSLSLNYTYIDAKFVEYQIIEDGVVAADYSGNRLSVTPENSATASIAYFIDNPFNQNGAMTLSADYAWNSKRYDDNSNEAPEIIDAYGLFDAQLVYELESWELILWGKNISDEEYFTHYAKFIVESYTTYGAPRTYGATLNWRF